MRFRLLEKNPPTKSEEDLIVNIKNAKSADEEDDALKLLLKQWGASDKLSSDGYRDIRRVILQSLKDVSFDKSNNDFIKYIIKNGDVLNADDAGKVDILKELLQYKLIEYNDNQDWWGNKSLYDRDDDEFEYTVKIFNIADNKELAGKYYDNPSDISAKQLYDGNRIKDSGLHDHNGDTIWNTVERWADEFSEKDLGSKNKKYSIRDLFEYKNIKHNNIYEEIDDLFKILDEEEFNEKILKNNTALFNEIKNSFHDRDMANAILSKKGLDSYNKGEVSKFIESEFKDIIEKNGNRGK